MKLSMDVPWLADPRAQALCHALMNAGHQALFVGGAVRNAIMGVGASDVDIATDAHPEAVIQLCTDQGMRCVPTGIEHGTVTVIIDSATFEVTTFRQDVATDGRRAVVAFSSDVAADAQRRDFTMNALYARSDGTVIDPLGGLPDALAKRVRFVGSPVDRMREDYLRILRFFRFSAWYADPSNGFDPDTLDAIAHSQEGLATLSAERIGAEMFKLLAAADPAPAVAAMSSLGVLTRIIPGASDTQLAPLVHLEKLLSLDPGPIRRFAILGGQDTPKRLRFSKAQARRYDLLQQNMYASDGPAALGYRLGQAAALDVVALRAAQSSRPPPKATPADIERGSKAQFPIQAVDLQPALEGRALGDKIKELEARWIASDFQLTRAELLV